MIIQKITCKQCGLDMKQEVSTIDRQATQGVVGTYSAICENCEITVTGNVCIVEGVYCYKDDTK